MSIELFRGPIAPVGDLDGPYLRDFWAAWEDDIPASPPTRRPHLVLVSSAGQADVPESAVTK
jgi:hypothetical protein